jgi:hypothetical protein
MVYNAQNYWVFGLFPSPGILENTTFRKLDLFNGSLRTELLGFRTFSIAWYSREHDVSETGSVSVLR